MDLSNLTLFRLMTKKMSWLGQRQQVLAENVANSDTPGYRPRDLEKFTFREALGDAHRLKPVATHPTHQRGTRDTGEPDSVRQKEVYETSPDGNAVVLEEQMMKVAETGADYQLVTNLYRKHVAMIKMALGGR